MQIQTQLARILSLSLVVLFLSACGASKGSQGSLGGYSSRDFRSDRTSTSSNAKGTMKPYTINGKTYYPTVVEVGETADGIASWYGPGFHGKKTSNGETYNQNALTAAHKTLPMNTILRVTNLNNGQKTTVRINDRGPFVDNRIIDLSKAAASQINMLQSGTAPVRLEVIGFGAIDKSHNIIEQNVNLGSSGEIVGGGRVYEGGGFMVQIGAFRFEEGAKSIANKYQKYQNYNAVVKNSPKDGLNRVFLKGFKSEEEAKDFAKSGIFTGAFVVRE